MEGYKAIACGTIAKVIWSWVVMRNIWQSANILGKQNILARKFNPDRMGAELLIR